MKQQNGTYQTYDIMHLDRRAARIDSSGHCCIYYRSFLPYNLYLDAENDDIDTLVDNLTNFYYWCATRVLTLDRTYAKEILNSIGMRQAAIEAVQKNGLHQIREVEQSCFEEMPETYGMFCKRLACLRAADAAHRQC